MTAIFNTSSLNSMAGAARQTGKKGYRSCELNNYMVEVVDFDNEVNTYEVDARSEQEASEMAESLAEADGMIASYCNVYRYIDSF